MANAVSSQAEAAPTPKPAPQLVIKAVKKPSTLKSARSVENTYTGGFCDCPAERGMVVEIAKFTPNPLGGQYPVVRPGSHSGQPLGVLLDDVVQPCKCDPLRDVAPIGGKVSICQGGWLTVGPFSKPVQAGELMFYDSAGRITTAQTGKPIGVALSASDDDGFVKVNIQLYLNEKAEFPTP